MKIKRKIIISVVSGTTTLTLIGAALFYYVAATSVRAELDRGLALWAHSRTSHIETVLTNYEQIGTNAALNEFFRRFLDLEQETSAYLEEQQLLNARLEISENGEEWIYGIHLIDKDGIVVASSKTNNIGTDFSSHDEYINAKERTFISSLVLNEVRGTPSLYISAPIVRLPSFEFLGMIIINIYPAELYSILTDRVGWGESGETYLINNDFLLISPSRFQEDTFLATSVQTENAQKCFQERITIDSQDPPEVIGPFLDYRGASVLGAYGYIPRMDWCLLAEIDYAESRGVINLFIQITLAAIIVIGLMGYGIAIAISRMISKPIEALHHGTEVVEKGNLDFKVGSDAKDEIGQLSRSFDSMTSAIKESRKDVDKKVKQQTKKIKETLTGMEEKQLELETLNKHMVGRELDMVRLKEEIEKLEKEKK